jgi:hypothetical protein
LWKTPKNPLLDMVSRIGACGKTCGKSGGFFHRVFIPRKVFHRTVIFFHRKGCFFPQILATFPQILLSFPQVNPDRANQKFTKIYKLSGLPLTKREIRGFLWSS